MILEEKVFDQLPIRTLLALLFKLPLLEGEGLHAADGHRLHCGRLLNLGLFSILSPSRLIANLFRFMSVEQFA